MSDKAPKYRLMVQQRLNKYIFPEFGATSLSEITSGDIFQLCRKIEDNGFEETAKRVKIIIGQIFRFTIAAD